jgi:hypothetical protein
MMNIDIKKMYHSIIKKPKMNSENTGAVVIYK